MVENKVLIAGATRTAVGKMGGALSTVPAAKLGEIVIREALKRSGVPADAVDMVYMGCVIQAGQGQNVARQASMNAGIPYTTPALTLNVVCGSGLEAVNTGARLIERGEADVVVAGGTENMSLAPFALKKARFGYRMNNGEIVDLMVNDALWDVFGDYHMGITAENVAKEYNLTREELDAFAAQSQNRAEEAQKSGRFKDEIVPVEVPKKKGQVEIFDQDEGIRYDQTAEGLAKLKPAFKKDGIVTAANSSGINDGAACVVLISEKKAKELNVKAQAVWQGGTLAGVKPEIMGIGPVAATRKLMNMLDFKVEDLDLIEANEAFATQSVAVVKDLGLDVSKVNVNGGAIAIGHPVGASGCRILVTLIHEMLKREDAKKGLATLCIGGGMGCATLIEKA